MVEAISSSRKRAWSGGLYSDADYLVGQSARIGEGWCEPELEFTWARMTGSSLAFSVGVHMSNSAGERPPPEQRAAAPAGAIAAIAARATINASPALKLNLKSKPISFVGLRG